LGYKSIKKRLKRNALAGYFIKKRASLKFYTQHPKSFLFKQKYTNQLKNQLNDINENTFFIVAVPGCLHILEICLRYIPAFINIIIISNGLSEWEQSWLSKNLKFSKTIILPSLFPHGDVINILVQNLEKPFGIMDYDCFVFNQDLFNEAVIINENHQLNAFFSNINKKINLELPETFFLYMNTPVYKKLKKNFNINCGHTTYFELPIKVRKKIKEIGITKTQMPEDFKNYFDTLRALMVVGIVEGYKINYTRKFPTVFKPSNEIFHVGGSSVPNIYKHLWGVRGSYLWRYVLQNHWDKELKDNYELMFGKKTPEEILDSFPDSRIKIGNEFFLFVQNLLLEKNY